MIRFPETAEKEWETVASVARASDELRRKIEHDTLVERKVEELRQRHEANLIFQQELDADQTPSLEMTTLTNYQANPAAAPVDLIDGVLRQDGLCIMLGPSGSGKSTLALQMLHSLLTGDDWLGRQVQTLNGGVGIVSYDMDSSMVLDWMSGYPNVDPDSVSVVNAFKRGNPLGVPAFRSQIVAAWKAMKCEIVVIDSFSASYFGQDQNDAAATMHHYRDLKLFALTEVGAKAVIVIAHSTESSPTKARGSSVHHDVADSIVSVTVNKAQQRKVDMVKYRAPRGHHQMTPVYITAPDDVTHLVTVDTGAMSMEGLPIPASLAASQQFPDMPDAHEAPDTERDEEDTSDEG